jgi:hypothetical protein
MAILIAWSLQKAYKSELNRDEWIMFSVLSFCILYLAIMLRQHYALGNQDRIVRLEFRLRYFELYSQHSKPVEDKLSFKQIAALRFAGDDEFVILLNRALKENLNPNDIKKAINNWRPDNNRV